MQISSPRRWGCDKGGVLFGADEEYDVRRSTIEKKQCAQCQETKALSNFGWSVIRKESRLDICRSCYRWNNPVPRDLLLKPQERQWNWELAYQRYREEECQRQEREEEARRQRKAQLLALPARRCVACGTVKPASDFALIHDGKLSFRQRCPSCHKVMRERRYPLCGLCARKQPYHEFLASFQGYSLIWNGIAFYVCCASCEAAFLAMSETEQRLHIRSACDQTFPAGQVIYALSDPKVGQVRYIGRTGNPHKRVIEHRRDRASQPYIDPMTGYVSNLKGIWIQDLYDQGRQPDLTVVHAVEIGPLVMEWERRYIAHGIQQGWDLLNQEAQDKSFVAMVQAAQVDFLQVPFEALVKCSLFAPDGLEAFVRAWYDAADNESLEADL